MSTKLVNCRFCDGSFWYTQGENSPFYCRSECKSGASAKRAEAQRIKRRERRRRRGKS